MHGVQADQIRNYINSHFFARARENGISQVKVFAEDVHEGLKLINRYPNVCSSMSNNVIQQKYNVRVIKITNSIGKQFEVLYKIL